MRNGIDVSGFSEIIDEVTNNPVEAQFRYATQARWTRSGGVCATVKPARIGSLRAPRTYCLPIEPRAALGGEGKVGEGGMLGKAAPEELALVALSGCFLVSVVSGLSAQKCTIEDLSMRVALELDQNKLSPASALYRISSKTDRSVERTLEVVETVKSMSPNHRTFAEYLPLRFCYGGTSLQLPPLRCSEGDGASSYESMQLQCLWHYGTQLMATLESEGKQRNFPIDQPKQLGGIDWAPNPQEYLLMALAGDILNGILDSGCLDRDVDDLTISTGAKVDIRGMCNVAEVPVHLQDIQIVLSSDSFDLSGVADIEALLTQVVDQSKVSGLIRRAVNFKFIVDEGHTHNCAS